MQTQIQNEHKDHGALGQWGDVHILGKVHKEYEVHSYSLYQHI